MASANHESLWRKLIEATIDVGDARISKAELNAFGQRALDAMLQDRLLFEEAISDELGICGCSNDECVAVLECIDGKYWSVCPSGQRRAIPLSEDDVTFYRLNTKELLKRLRAANELTGEDISIIAKENIYLLGKTEAGIDPLSVLYCRRLSRRNATDVFHQARGAITGDKILLATANGFNLGLTESRQAEALNIFPFRLCDYQKSPDSPRLDWSAIVSKVLQLRKDETRAMLFVDSTCHYARFKNQVLDISSRPFVVLVALAKTAKRSFGEGYVLTEDIQLQLTGRSAETIQGTRLADNVREIRNVLQKMAAENLLTDADVNLIENKKGVGYRLTIPHEQILVI
ncbi:MAG TPA: hypothetical protein PKW95_13285 [bacterium]|nr:hypothetical protein [bacterium]